MKKLLSTLLIAALVSGTAAAAFTKADAGTAGAQFLKLGAGARPAGMGDAVGALADDSTSIYWNPAGLNYIDAQTMCFMHGIWFEDTTYNWFSYAQPIKNIGKVGIGIQTMSYGPIKELDDTGLEGSNINPADFALSLAYAKRFFGINFGASAKYISSTIKNTATAYAVDLGAIKMMLVNDKPLYLGLAAQNLGTKLKYSEEEEQLPLNIKLGSAYFIKKNWATTLDINAPIDNDPYYAIGTEYNYKLTDKAFAAARAGYNTRNKDTGGLNGITAGMGITYMHYSIDYAFVPYGNMGDTHRISLNIKF